MAVLAIDWDNTLMNGRTWLPGAQTSLKRLSELGHRIIIWSCNERSWIEKNLEEAGIKVDWVCRKDDGKPLADLYVDDRAYQFPRNGDWDNELSNILLRLEGLDNRKW